MILRRALLLAALPASRAAMAQPARPLVAVLTIGGRLLMSGLHKQQTT